ncbi:tolloid-like protein 1 [Trichonephila clavipes]|nr:tolloid-like protein 1 [Trichonephila clavipes]
MEAAYGLEAGGSSPLHITVWCTDGGFLKIYIQGQEERQALDEFDLNLCGRILPPPVLSEGPRLSMVFSSGPTGSSTGKGFRALYKFETDYKVPGTPAPDGTCNFTFLSKNTKRGEFNSPRHPANYPSNTSCVYIFKGEPGTQIKIVFNYFRTKTQHDLGTTGYKIPDQHDGPKLLDPPLRFLKRPALSFKTSGAVHFSPHAFLLVDPYESILEPQLIRAHWRIIRQSSTPLVSSKTSRCLTHAPTAEPLRPTVVVLPPLRTIRHRVCKATVSCLGSDLVHSSTARLLFD